jgi:hypothetical protein
MNHFSSLTPGRFRVRFGLIILIIGLGLMILGADPAVFNLDQSPITGFIQITVFLIGLALICIGGYIALSALWGGREKTIAADIGLRLVSTGYVISFGSGFADIFGFGTHKAPAIPYFGPWQAAGVMVGEGIIIIGFILLIPFPAPKE